MFRKLKISRNTQLVGIILLFLIILRIPSIFETHWYTDEGFFSCVANSFQFGKLVYKDISTNYMPGIFFIFYIANFSATLSLVFVKIINLLASIGSVILIFKIAKALFDEKTAIISSFIATILLGLPLLDANIATPENFFVFFTLLGLFFLLKEKSIYLILAGLSFGISLLFSLSPIVEIVFFLASYHILTKKNNKSYITLLSNLVPIILTVIYFFRLGIGYNFLNSVLDLKIANDTNDSLGFVFLPNTLLTRTILLAVILGFFLCLVKNKKLSKPKFFVSCWLVFTIYAALINQESFTHFLIQTIPPFSISISLFIEKLNSSKNTVSKMYSIILFSLMSVFTLNLFTFGQALKINVNPIQYYLNFVKYLTGKIDSISYVQFFNNQTYEMYRLNSFLMQNYAQEEGIYVWTDNLWIYKLANINPPVEHLRSYEAKENMGELKSSLTRNSPSLVIIDQNAQDPKELLEYLDENSYEFKREFEDYEIYVRE